MIRSTRRVETHLKDRVPEDRMANIDRKSMNKILSLESQRHVILIRATYLNILVKYSNDSGSYAHKNC
jgi:hypothetical protein